METKKHNKVREKVVEMLKAGLGDEIQLKIEKVQLSLQTSQLN